MIAAPAAVGVRLVDEGYVVIGGDGGMVGRRSATDDRVNLAFRFPRQQTAVSPGGRGDEGVRHRHPGPGRTGRDSARNVRIGKPIRHAIRHQNGISSSRSDEKLAGAPPPGYRCRPNGPALRSIGPDEP